MLNWSCRADDQIFRLHWLHWVQRRFCASGVSETTSANTKFSVVIALCYLFIWAWPVLFSVFFIHPVKLNLFPTPSQHKKNRCPASSTPPSLHYQLWFAVSHFKSALGFSKVPVKTDCCLSWVIKQNKKKAKIWFWSQFLWAVMSLLHNKAEIKILVFLALGLQTNPCCFSFCWTQRF